MERWEARWKTEARKPHREAATWKGDWKATPIHLYDDLTKAEATALFLLRTQVLGVKAWLASIGVPDVDPQCECGFGAESLKHLLGLCPNKTWQRIRLVERTGTQDLEALVTEQAKVKAAARWLLDLDVLEQFRVAKEIEKENMESWVPFQLSS